MRILLQDRDTGLYLAEAGNWTGNPKEARDFGAGEKVVIAARTQAIARPAMVYVFDDSSMNFSIGLSGQPT